MSQRTQLQPGQHCPHCGEIKGQSKSPGWWHWFIEWCPTCKCNSSQQPVRDDLGEDCILFGKVDKYRVHQQQDDAYRCDCGTKLEPHYRHALADCNCITKEGEPFGTAPLLPKAQQELAGRVHNTEGGTFIDAAEFEKLLISSKLESDTRKAAA